jgi:hypothetical protein
MGGAGIPPMTETASECLEAVMDEYCRGPTNMSLIEFLSKPRPSLRRNEYCATLARGNESLGMAAIATGAMQLVNNGRRIMEYRDRWRRDPIDFARLRYRASL